MQEIWKKIKGFEYYEVSNLGNVKSLDKESEMIWFIDSPKRIKKGKILKKILKGGAYNVVTFYDNGFFQKYIHRLVAEAFIGVIPKTHTVNHIDGNKINNRVDNLEIISYRNNSIHANLNKNQTSKYVGVYWNKARGKWVAMARASKGEKKYLGGFDSEIDAYNAYLKFTSKIEEIKYKQ